MSSTHAICAANIIHPSDMVLTTTTVKHNRILCSLCVSQILRVVRFVRMQLIFQNSKDKPEIFTIHLTTCEVVASARTTFRTLCVLPSPEAVVDLPKRGLSCTKYPVVKSLFFYSTKVCRSVASFLSLSLNRHLLASTELDLR